MHLDEIADVEVLELRVGNWPHRVLLEIELEPAAAVIAPRIIAQTNAELAAGRKLVDYNEALAVNRTPRPPDPSAGKNEAVFRPGDYVPDQKKGQGNNTQARTL